MPLCELRHPADCRAIFTAAVLSLFCLSSLRKFRWRLPHNLARRNLALANCARVERSSAGAAVRVNRLQPVWFVEVEKIIQTAEQMRNMLWLILIPLREESSRLKQKTREIFAQSALRMTLSTFFRR